MKFNDESFKERIINLIKEKNISIAVYNYYNNSIQIFVRKLFNLGYMDIYVEENIGRDTALLDECFEPKFKTIAFEDEGCQNEAVIKINKVLTDFLNKEYQKYKQLMKYQA